MTTVNTRAGADKRSLEAAVHTMQAEIDDRLHQAKNSEEKAKKAMVDAARLADELRAEQDHVNTQSKAKHSMEVQLSELEARFAEATDATVEVALPWQSWRAASVSSRLNLETSREGLERTRRATRRPSARSRSSRSRLTKTRRTRIG